SLYNLSVNQGAWSHFTQPLGSGYSNMTVTISGGFGDADLYVRQGSKPTKTDHDCRPYLSGNNETCAVSNPASGTWHVGVFGYSAYSGVSLKSTVQ
ncbi:MAG: PPC domain-containing protein, partial [Psychrosphaera sp.]|nr:PPC domain-containing protein [Psychrosphaera sp.]